MERLEGVVIREEEPDRFARPAARSELGLELIDTLALIHEIDYPSVGLDEFGHPNGFTERQVDRWEKQLEWAFERTADVRSVPELEEVGTWLQAHFPEDYPHTLVHGDYKLDNVMFGPNSDPELIGVFDWELPTLGDPFTDLGWLLLFWHDRGDSSPPIPELQSTFMAREGYPSRRDLVTRYEEQTGRPFENERFYRVLGVYKLAGLGEMFFRRYLEGNSDDPMYPSMESRVPALAEEAIRIINADDPV
jgi:aminoglycoside phosphotransferase (APT) family kinase protein